MDKLFLMKENTETAKRLMASLRNELRRHWQQVSESSVGLGDEVFAFQLASFQLGMTSWTEKLGPWLVKQDNQYFLGEFTPNSVHQGNVTLYHWPLAKTLGLATSNRLLTSITIQPSGGIGFLGLPVVSYRDSSYDTTKRKPGTSNTVSHLILSTLQLSPIDTTALVAIVNATVRSRFLRRLGVDGEPLAPVVITPPSTRVGGSITNGPVWVEDIINDT
ncbi:hypothetical protein L210DRAFT_3508905 [Boletus edulis BED1]|uniref:Uncharacterized protein n=1 Tax=Boletus edulis BED1 TaxID=1328754 RepID=A0AAD4BG56_BOLED|nr:hypothetical protein L210DRAFT_3508905 [Boletus edulis BED1]